MPTRYVSFAQYLRGLAGGIPVHKVTVDAGFSCPNRDGTISYGGCAYCDNRGFNIQSRTPGERNVGRQIKEGIAAIRRRNAAAKVIVYFQAYTNTYAPVDVLKAVYDTAVTADDVVGIAIATRPDCVNAEILALINSYAARFDIWVEYGLQTMHNSVLAAINRGHTYEDFLKAVDLTRQHARLKICAHTIIGLPGETQEMMCQTARALGKLHIDGIKIHPLHIIRDTPFHAVHARGELPTLTLDEYAQCVVQYLSYLWPKTVIHRLTADCPAEFLVAPGWINRKQSVLEAIHSAMDRAGIVQGSRFAETSQTEGSLCRQ